MNSMYLNVYSVSQSVQTSGERKCFFKYLCEQRKEDRVHTKAGNKKTFAFVVLTIRHISRFFRIKF